MTATHNLPDELLLDYATGAATEPVAALTSAHVALNAHSRETLHRLEAVGGALLEETAPMPLADGSLARAMTRLGTQNTEAPARDSRPRHESDLLPGALRAYAPDGIDALRWRKLGWGMAEAPLACRDDGDYRLSLLRIEPGRKFPSHGHRGEEFVMVLDGGFSDANGHYLRGDVCCSDETTEHRPVADADGACLCVVVRQGAIRLHGLLGLILNLFLR